MEELQSYIERFRKDPYLELEMRLCSKSSDTLSKDKFYELYDLLMSSYAKGIFEHNGRQTYADMFYENGIRQRVVIGIPSVVQKAEAAPKLIANCPQRDEYTFRFTLKSEIPEEQIEYDPGVLEPFNIKTAVPHFMRLQQVWSFVYKQHFEYSLKKVVSGKNKEEACVQEERYEVELELLRNQAYLDSKTNEEIAMSLIEKSLDLTKRFNEQNVAEKLIMLFGADTLPLSKKEAKLAKKALLAEKMQKNTDDKEENEAGQDGEEVTITTTTKKRKQIQSEAKPPKSKQQQQLSFS